MKAIPGKTAKSSKTLAKASPSASKVAVKQGAAAAAPKAAAKAATKNSPRSVAPAPTRAAAAASPPPESSKLKMPSASTTKPTNAAAKVAPAPAAPPAKAKAATPAETPRPAADPAPPAAAAPGTVTQRPGRPSSRLASLTVPSMAQSVASTAAKASYMQLAAAPLIVPPLPSAIKKDPKLANNWKTKPVEQLTDAELLAMPDSEYMNDKQLAAFRLKLSLLKQDILNSAGETTEHLREDTVVVPDPADRATIEEEHALELRTRDRERKLLKKIEQSIARIDAGDYGYCDETGEPIGVGRLLARPTATLSLEAQQRRELKQKMFGD